MPPRLSLRSCAPLAALAAVLVLVLGLEVPARAAAKLAVADVAQELTCQCGCGLTVANCNHPNCKFAIPARKQIAEMIDKGMGKTEIIAFFRNKYGEKILSSPTMEGFNLLAWTMPFAALALGGAFILLALARWQRAASPSPAGSEAAAGSAPVIDSRLKERLDKLVREQL